MASRFDRFSYNFFKGGPGSGNFGHAGRPGQHGGSGPGDSSDAQGEMVGLSRTLNFGASVSVSGRIRQIKETLKQARNFAISAESRRRINDRLNNLEDLDKKNSDSADDYRIVNAIARDSKAILNTIFNEHERRMTGR